MPHEIIRLMLLCCLFASAVSPLKLTLKQDMKKVLEELAPEELGQFLHSIDDLPQLAEMIDPSRTELEFNLFYYYSYYGCREDRIFNMARIQRILTYPNLSRVDRALLLHHDCIANWTQLTSVPEKDLKFVLMSYPESNPLLHFQKYEDFDSLMDNFCWFDLKKNSPDRLNLIIDQAHQARNLEAFSMRAAVEKLVIRGYLSTGIHLKSDHFGLITHKIVKKCYAGSRKTCTPFFIKASENWSMNFTNFDVFHWLLNVASMVMNDRKQFPEIDSHFQKIRDRIRSPWFNSFLTDFSRRFEGLILKVLAETKKKSVMATDWIQEFKNICKDRGTPLGSFFEGLQSSAADNSETPDPIYVAIELYNWLKSNTYLSGKVLQDIFNIIQMALTRVPVHNPNHVIERFFKDNAPLIDIGKFTVVLLKNYDLIHPSEVLIQNFLASSFRSRISMNKNSYNDTVLDVYKSNLSYNFRLGLLRRLCFKHSGQFDKNEIEIFVPDDVRADVAVFEKLYSAFLEGDVLPYPLMARIYGVGVLRGLLRDGLIDAKSVIKTLWLFLGTGIGNFFKMEQVSDDEEDDYKVKTVYVARPHPWTNPNVLFVTGAVMTLALLYGVKLRGWCVDSQIFFNVFKLKVTEEDDTTFPESQFFQLNSYSKTLNTFDLVDREPIEPSIEKLVEMSAGFSSTKKRILAAHQSAHLQERPLKYTHRFDDIDTIWDGQIFDILKKMKWRRTESDEEYMNRVLRNDLDTSLKPNLLIKRLENLALLGSEIDLTETPDLARRMAETQLFSLFLGMEPLTRILSADEAYLALFEDCLKL